MAGQVMNMCKAQLCEPESFIGVPSRNVGEAEMAQTSCITETHPNMLARPLELAAQLLQGTQSVSASLRQLSPGEPLLGSRAWLRVSLSTYLLSRKEGLRCIRLDNFRDFLKPSSCWLSELLGDALLRLGSSRAQRARRPSVFPLKGFN